MQNLKKLQNINKDQKNIEIQYEVGSDQSTNLKVFWGNDLQKQLKECITKAKEYLKSNFSIFTVEMTDEDFEQLSKFIHEQWGINLPPHKKILLEGRLRKRLQQLGMKSFHEYCEYLFTSEGLSIEPSYIVDLVTTNKTDFMREPQHYDILQNLVLPQVNEMLKQRCIDVVEIWSAGCSSGEEPYTLAMVLSNYQQRFPEFKFSIFATDISSKVLKTAIDAIYPEERIEPIPLEWRKKYLLKSKDPQKKLVRIAPEIRSKVEFKRSNLLNTDSEINRKFAIIFCRNVLIYFDKATQINVLRQLYNKLIGGGYLFVGHSEALTNINIPFKSVAPTVYKKLEND